MQTVNAVFRTSAIGIEVPGLFGGELTRGGVFRRGIGPVNEDFGRPGVAIIAIFAAGRLISAIVDRLKRSDSIDITSP